MPDSEVDRYDYQKSRQIAIYQFGLRDDDNDDLWHRIDKQSAENSANTVELTNGLFQKKLNRSVFIMSALHPTMQ